MQRIKSLTKEQAGSSVLPVLEGIEKKIGRIPNIYSAVANSPAALKGFLELGGIIEGAALGPVVREKIALALAEFHGCDYCLAAHTVIAGAHGASSEEILDARAGQSGNPKERKVIELALKLVKNRGDISDKDIDLARKAGITDGEIVEIILVAALNIFTNYFNHVAKTELDFPPVKPLENREQVK